MMNHEITCLVPKKKPRTRRGRGTGSGLGKTSGRGHKGQNSRPGKTSTLTGEGGQMPLFRRLPKRGFNNYRFKTTYTVINLDRIKDFKKDQTVDPQALIQAGLIHDLDEKVKILGWGQLTHPLTVLAHKFSRAATQKIAAAGGTAKLINGKETASANVQSVTAKKRTKKTDKSS
ncbi:MAG: 50S ribosomal protein L15 [Planctomycetes bacterium]|nr:50S ribosomal protein L15 [Planctomycetota bacterium]